MIFKYFILGCSILILGFQKPYAQSLRSLNNNGVDKYKEKKFADAEVNFKKGLEKAPENFVTNFNLGDAYYQQKRYDEALNSYRTALTQTGTNGEKAKVYHNIGNSLLKSNQLKESIEAYKNSLKLNPNDEETKYNLSYALSMLKNQQNQQNKNQQNKDQNQNQNQQNKDQQNKQNQQNQNQQQNQTAKQDATKQQQNKISKQEAERILQALKNNETELQKKLRRQKGVPVKTDKDW